MRKSQKASERKRQACRMQLATDLIYDTTQGACIQDANTRASRRQLDTRVRMLASKVNVARDPVARLCIDDDDKDDKDDDKNDQETWIRSREREHL